MPTYKITGPDGRTLNVTGPVPPSEAEIDEIFARMSPASKMQTPPVPAELPTPKAPTPAGGATNPGLPEEHTTLEGVLGALNTVPKQLQQGAASVIDLAQGETTLLEAMKKQVSALHPHSKVTGETPLEAAGMQDGMLRSALGVGLDLVSPTGPIGAGVKLVGKGIKAVPGVADAMNAAGKSFTKYHGLDKFKARSADMTMQDYMRLHDSTIDAASTVSKQQVAEIFKGMNDRDRWAIANFLADSKYSLPSGRTDLQDAAFKLKKTFGDQAAAQVNMGFMDPATVVGKDYFPQVRKSTENPRALVVDDVDATDRFTKQRSMSWEKHIASPNVVDPAKAAQTRLAAGDRAMKTSELLSLVGQEFGMNVKAGVLPAGFRPLNLKHVNVPEQQKAVMKTMAFPEEIAQTLEKAHVIEADPEGWKKMWVGVNRGFKTVVTTFNPAHHFNNWQGNAYLMYLGGMSPLSVVKAYHKIPELHALMGDAKGAAQVAALRAKELRPGLTTGDAYDIARQYNVFGSSEAAIEFDRAVGKAAGHPLLDGAVKKADQVRYSTSRYIEDPARWALFKDQLLKGKTPEHAALHVKKHLFDYNELTDMEKKIRDYGAVPFYTFLRKNLPLHVSSIAENPGRLKNLQTAYTAPSRILDPEDKTLQPAWQKEEGYHPVGEADKDGNIPLVRLANPGLDLNKVPGIGSTRALLKSSLGPAPSAAIEFMTGRDLRTGAQILDTPTGYTAASPLGSAAAQLQMQTGIPMPRFGTVPTPEGKMIQPEMLAFAFNQIPVPLLPYAQRIAGAPGETIGTQLSTGPGKRLADILLRSVGLTPRSLTPEQQIAIVDQMLKQMLAPVDTQIIQQTGEAMMKGPQKK